MNKYLRLVLLLIKRTAENSAAWEPTPRSDVFSFSLPEYSVRISMEPGENGDDVTFQIVNSNGTIIDTFTDVQALTEMDIADRSELYARLVELYNSARR